MKSLSLSLILISLSMSFAYAGNEKITHKKITKTIQSLQSSYWIIKDLQDSKEINCKTPSAQELFDLAHQNLDLAANTLKSHIVSNTITEDILLASKKMILDTYRMYKTLIFLNEIITTKKNVDLKFEEARFRQMRAAVFITEYIQNGDEDIFDAINQRNSAKTFLMQRLPSAFVKESTDILPKYISQTDLKLIEEIIANTNHGAIKRYMLAYFTDHLTAAVKENMKGETGILLLKKAGAWSLEALSILPGFISKDMYKDMSEIINNTPEFQIKEALLSYLSQ